MFEAVYAQDEDDRFEERITISLSPNNTASVSMGGRMIDYCGMDTSGEVSAYHLGAMAVLDALGYSQISVIE